MRCARVPSHAQMCLPRRRRSPTPSDALTSLVDREDEVLADRVPVDPIRAAGNVVNQAEVECEVRGDQPTNCRWRCSTLAPMNFTRKSASISAVAFQSRMSRKNSMRQRGPVILFTGALARHSPEPVVRWQVAWLSQYCVGTPLAMHMMW